MQHSIRVTSEAQQALLMAVSFLPGADRSMVSDALGNIINSWPGHLRQAVRAKLTPFIDAAAEQRGTSLELRAT